MATLTIELDNALADEIANSARREKKTPNVWAAERLKVAAMDEAACVNGYPPGWLKLFGAIPDSDHFEAPPRSECRDVDLDGDAQRK